jgi:hypothetical protein
VDKLTKKLAVEVINGLLYSGYEIDAEEPAEGDEDLQDWVNALGELNEKHGPDMVIALADFVEDHLSEHVNVHEVEGFAERTFKGSGHEKGAVLKAHAEHDEFDLGKLWEVLDESGGMDSFNWDDFAESGSPWVNHLVFIEAATTGSADTVYLFEED